MVGADVRVVADAVAHVSDVASSMRGDVVDHVVHVALEAVAEPELAVLFALVLVWAA